MDIKEVFKSLTALEKEINKKKKLTVDEHVALTEKLFKAGVEQYNDAFDILVQKLNNIELDLNYPIEEEEEVLEEADTSEPKTPSKKELIEQELLYLKNNKLVATEISARYNKNNSRKNNYSMKELYKHLDGKGNPSELEMSKFIFDSIHK